MKIKETQERIKALKQPPEEFRADMLAKLVKYEKLVQSLEERVTKLEEKQLLHEQFIRHINANAEKARRTIRNMPTESAARPPSPYKPEGKK